MGSLASSAALTEEERKREQERDNEWQTNATKTKRAIDLFARFYHYAFEEDREGTPLSGSQQREREIAKEFCQRFKILFRVPDGAMAMFGSAFNQIAGSLNGKPKLMRKNVHFYRGKKSEWMYQGGGANSDRKESVLVRFPADWLEIDIMINRWPYVARYAAFQARSQLKLMSDLLFAFTVEGRDEEELPERVIGAAVMHHIDFLQPTPAKDLTLVELPRVP